MRTEHINILLPDYIQGMLDAETTSRIRNHLKICSQCQEDLRDLQSAIAAIAEQKIVAPPKSYFASILPRVRERIEKRDTSSWIFNPIVNRVAVPLGAAIILVVLAWHIPRLGEAGDAENPLQAVVGSATVDEIANLVQDQYPHQDWSIMNSNIIGRALTNDRFLEKELVKEALASESISPFNVFADVSPQQFLKDLNDAESETLMKRLGTMEVL